MIQKGSLEKLDIRTVVLVGGQDFGRSPLAAHLPVALWPIADKPVLQRLLDHLADEGIDSATVCCAKDVSAAVERVCTESRLSVTLVTEELTSGTAGCVRDAVASDPGELLVLFSAGIAAPPRMQGLIEAHRAGGAELTMAFNPGGEDGSEYGAPAEIYVCQPSILSHIPAGGYSDIKEAVIPSVLQTGRVHPMALPQEVGNFRDRNGYLRALHVFLRNKVCSRGDSPIPEHSEEALVLKGTDVFVHPAARIYGPVVIGKQAQILEGAVVIGPAMIGQSAVLGEGSVIVRSALWAGAVAGAHCEVRESIVGCNVAVPAGAEVVERALSADVSDRGREKLWTQHVRGGVSRIGSSLRSSFDRIEERLPGWVPLSPKQLAYGCGGIIVLLAFLWSYWPTLIDLMIVWKRSDEYSSGLLVPFLAVYVIWTRREDLAPVPVRPAILWGAGLFLFAQAVRGAGLYLMFHSAERLSLILSLVALVLLLTGWRYLGKLASVLVFLCLMFPWPRRLQGAVALPLQSWATTSAVFCLELVGYEVLRDGNVIHIGDSSVAVAEACNGLRMVTAFFVINALVVLLVRRAWWEKLLVVVSSLPIALLCNTLRLAVTAILFTIIEGEGWKQRFHDWDGYAMMPLAIGMVVGELWLLARLTTPPVEVKPVIISRRPAGHVPDS